MSEIKITLEINHEDGTGYSGTFTELDQFLETYYFQRLILHVESKGKELVIRRKENRDEN